MRPLIAGNWKMNGLTIEAAALVRDIAAGAPALATRCDLLVCPPAIQLAAVAAALAGSAVMVGGQDCHTEPSGPHTGDVSAAMLRDAGARWVILGHSERRIGHAETDDLVRAKAVAAVQAELTPIICVGETEDQRSAGQETEIVGWQLAGSLPDGFTGAVAYEPVWAIGSGKVATTAEVAAMHAFIRAELVRQFPEHGGTIRVLYGGSVKPANAAELLGLPEVGGALVGGASLVAAEFLAIAAAAKSLG